jgi:hypothetical protein
MAIELAGGRALASWSPLESRTLRVFAFLAPAVWLPVVWMAWKLTNVPILSPWTLLAVGLALLVSPSVQDVRGALGRQNAQIEADS